jgi:hypothetical protein
MTCLFRTPILQSSSCLGDPPTQQRRHLRAARKCPKTLELETTGLPSLGKLAFTNIRIDHLDQPQPHELDSRVRLQYGDFTASSNQARLIQQMQQDEIHTHRESKLQSPSARKILARHKDPLTGKPEVDRLIEIRHSITKPHIRHCTTSHQRILSSKKQQKPQVRQTRIWTCLGCSIPDKTQQAAIQYNVHLVGVWLPYGNGLLLLVWPERVVKASKVYPTP